LLSFPRDTYVHLAGTGKNDRINTAYAKGVNSLVRTLQENFNIPINHVAEVDFAGFQEIVGTLGGIEICFDHPARDKVTKLDVPAGCQLLNQTQSTAYVRSRHYEQFIDGAWKSDGRGDIGRVQRQQRFIKQVMDKVIGSGGRNPITAQGLISDLKSAVTLDKTYGITELYGTAKTFSAFEPDALQGFTLPTSAARIDGKAVLRVRRDQASQVVALFGTRN
jgi:polyisoprenyl-teichoic acid--peptidoglycan teichoic acid transferase